VVELNPEGYLVGGHAFVEYWVVGLMIVVDDPDYEGSLVDLDFVGMVVDDLDFE